MDKITLKNGSTIETICESTANNRGRRSELMGFYCIWCKDVHVDYPIKNIQWIGDDMMCKESWDKVLEPYMNTERKQIE